MEKENPDQLSKKFYRIGDVAILLDLPQSTLRFWEKEFEQISPRKTGKGTRSYRQEDIDAIRLVYHLVKERGMTWKKIELAISLKAGMSMKI